ncbi:MAG: hypothetical protein NC453_28395 [Muribaculum sp.]|nr:hypothetical protein [Muribaculum sp.]
MIDVANRVRLSSLIGEDNLLKELIEMPINKVMAYADKSEIVNPEEALRYLSDMFIENCGVSLSTRGFADYCSGYWIKKLDMEHNPEMNEKYHGAYTLGQLLPCVSDKYYDGLLDEYDSCAMTHSELRSILFTQLDQLDDEKAKTIICAGICDALNAPDYHWLYDYPIEKIEEGIINFKNNELIHHRAVRDRRRFLPLCNNYNSRRQFSPYKFSDEEVAHFIILNGRLVELQHEIMDHVKVITQNLQEQIEKGFHQYDTFCIEGYIYIEPFEEDPEDKLLEILTSCAKYTVIFTNDDSTQESITKNTNQENNWYANWSGIFHQLEESHGLRLCRAFRYLFDDAEIFTIADIMKIKPEMFLPHIQINI